MKPLRPSPSVKQQRGAAFMVMLVIMIMGVSFFLVSSLSKVSLQTARNEQSVDMLAQAKEVIVGYLLSGGNSHPPGMMMYPDVLDAPSTSEKRPDGSQGSNYDGEWDGGCLDLNQAAAPTPYTPLTSSVGNMPTIRCLGRLPWKSLGLSVGSPSENDPTGFMPWFAFSRNLIDSSQKINSELLNTNARPWLKVYDMHGTLLSDRVAFVIIVPGPALPSQSRPPSLASPNQYLDKISIPPGCIGAACSSTINNADLTERFVTGEEHRWMNDLANPGQQIEDTTYQFNDKVLYVTIDELMPLIEKRVARDVKTCLDDYANAAINTGQRYPWAAAVDVSTPFPRAGVNGIRFGRFPEDVTTTSGGTPPTRPVLTYILGVQTALNNYLATPTNPKLSDLRDAGDLLEENTSSGSPAHTAGNTADGCSGMSCTTLLQNQLDAALSGGGTADTTMPSSWSTIPSCNQLIFTSSYWADWRDLVFYQVANGYRPGGGTYTALQISGSGNANSGSGTTYRAAVIIAGKKLGVLQTRTTPYSAPPPNDYLANTTSESSTDSAFVTNAHDDAAPSTSFITYKTSDPYYQSVNDLVLCVDGKNYCK